MVLTLSGLQKRLQEASDDTKKMREDSSTTSFSENDDAFLEGLKSDDCRNILPNCFTNIQEKIEELFVIVKKITKHKLKAKSNLKA